MKASKTGYMNLSEVCERLNIGFSMRGQELQAAT